VSEISIKIVINTYLLDIKIDNCIIKDNLTEHKCHECSVYSYTVNNVINISVNQYVSLCV